MLFLFYHRSFFLSQTQSVFFLSLILSFWLFPFPSPRQSLPPTLLGSSLVASSAGRIETERSRESSWIARGCVLRLNHARDSLDTDGFAENASLTQRVVGLLFIALASKILLETGRRKGWKWDISNFKNVEKTLSERLVGKVHLFSGKEWDKCWAVYLSKNA